MEATEIIVALGPHRYRTIRRWGNLPEGSKLREMSKLAVDSQGDVYVYQRTDPPVVVFDREGRYARSFGKGLVADPHGIFISPDDRVWLVDRGGHQVLICDRLGNLLFTVGERHHANFQAPFNHPADVAVAANGDFYVADGYGNSMVHWFGPEGELRKSWGRPGQGPGQFVTPHGIGVLIDGRVIVGDRENNRIQVFSPEGDYLTEWHDLYKPMDIYVDPRGLIYVSDQVPRLTMLTAEGEVVGRCMATPKEGHGVRGDPQGNFYIAETVYDYVIKLERLA
ncbi:MAG: peptidyl-alpha-hydroxyglycine alpha-amidating lyase family protein [Rhodospirillales bacterium]|jgi:peptidylglycine monooxygenase|nr:peptidyl-alpha-hydroxyglycine alpha-amidating lyase family protein [Rhodospirillales bacterium]